MVWLAEGVGRRSLIFDPDASLCEVRTGARTSASWTPEAQLEALIGVIETLVSGKGLPALPPLSAEEKEGLSALEQRRLYRIKQNEVRYIVVSGRRCQLPYVSTMDDPHSSVRRRSSTSMGWVASSSCTVRRCSS